MKSCKRMTVSAIGTDYYGYRAFATNGNFTEAGCTNEVGRCGCIHAEINLLQIIPNPKIVDVSHSPCLDCAKALVEAGVMVINYEEEYRIKDGIHFLQNNGVQVRKKEEKK